MLRAPLLTAVAALVVFAATAPAQTPTATPPDPTATAPTPTPAATAPEEEVVTTVTTVTWFKNPIVRWGVPAAAVLAITVIGLFVTRWRRSGEIPGPPVAP